MPATTRKQSREARIIAAIEAYDPMYDEFIALAADAAEFEGDADFDEIFRAAESAMNTFARPLRNLLAGCKPVVYRDRVYALNRDGQAIVRTEVQTLV